MTERNTLMYSVVLLIVGVAGFFILNSFWIHYIFAHVGALGIVGLLAVAAGAIAKSRGRDFRNAFLIGTIYPVALGVIAVLLFRYLGDRGVFYCGGVVSLAVSVLIIIGYLFARRKTAPAGQA